MELAETLQRLHGVPFRVGHHFASEVVVYARAHQLRPKDFPYAEAVRIYKEAGAKYGLADARLPLAEADFRQSLSPAWMVNTRSGIGGPQPAEVQRMLNLARTTLEKDRSWLSDAKGRLLAAQTLLDDEFARLCALP